MAKSVGPIKESIWWIAMDLRAVLNLYDGVGIGSKEWVGDPLKWDGNYLTMLSDKEKGLAANVVMFVDYMHAKERFPCSSLQKQSSATYFLPNPILLRTRNCFRHYHI